MIDSVICPNCQQKNWINFGDMNDDTQPDVEACECWSCGNEWFIDPENCLAAMDGETPGSSMIEKGRKSPNYAAGMHE